MKLDLKTYKEEQLELLKAKFLALNEKCKVLIIEVGDDPGSKVYLKNKIKALTKVGVDYVLEKFPCDASEDELITLITKANEDPSITGILLQLPLPEHLTLAKEKIINSIDKDKDIDGLTIYNKGLLASFSDCLIPCTAKGIMRIFKLLNVSLKGKNVVIINRSELIGLPLFFLLLKEDASVRIVHSQVKNIKEYTKKADIVVTAVGKKNFITKDMVRKGALIIDAGIVREGRLVCGDVDYINVSKKAFVTKVPYGVGQMTVLEFIDNIYRAFLLKNGKLQ